MKIIRSAKCAAQNTSPTFSNNFIKKPQCQRTGRQVIHTQSPGRLSSYRYIIRIAPESVSYTHLRAHETPEHLVCRLLLEKKKNITHKKENTDKEEPKRNVTLDTKSNT